VQRKDECRESLQAGGGGAGEETLSGVTFATPLLNFSVSLPAAEAPVCPEPLLHLLLKRLKGEDSGGRSRSAAARQGKDEGGLPAWVGIAACGCAGISSPMPVCKGRSCHGPSCGLSLAVQPQAANSQNHESW